MSNFKNVDRDTPYLLPPSIQDWLPENHLARFVVDVVSELNLRPFRNSYRSGGSAAFDPSVLLALLFYGYATGVYSSRKLEQASYESIPIRFICGNSHPDHDTIANFRKRFLKEIGDCFVQILLMAKELDFLKLGTISIDGTKVKANASKHSAMSYGYASELEKRLQAEIDQLLEMANQTDENETFTPDIPHELEIRNRRLEKIRAAKQVIEDRAQQRDTVKQAAYQDKLAERERKEKQTGKKPGGKPPAPPRSGPESKDQYNFTDPESAIMKTGSSNFDQCYNAQAAVDQASMLIVGEYLSDSGSDCRQYAAVLESIPRSVGRVENVAADAGYFSEENVKHSAELQIEAFIATGRQSHNPGLHEILKQKCAPSLAEIETGAMSAREAMKLRLNTTEGREIYRLRKCTVEPVFGIIKQALGFRQFLLRGLKNVRGEWSLVCSAYNLKRLHSLKIQNTAPIFS